MPVHKDLLFLLIFETNRSNSCPFTQWTLCASHIQCIASVFWCLLFAFNTLLSVASY